MMLLSTRGQNLKIWLRGDCKDTSNMDERVRKNYEQVCEV